MRLINLMRQFSHDEDATTAVEYAVMLAMILLVIMTTIGSFGSNQNVYWGKIDNEMQAHGIH